VRHPRPWEARKATVGPPESGAPGIRHPVMQVARPPPVDEAARQKRAGGPDWQAAMLPVYETVQQAGWPVTGGLRRALRAKAVRVDRAARGQGASGPVWVAEAMLVALGRKSGPSELTDEELLAYADGVLNNWMRDGRSRTLDDPLHQAANHPHEAETHPHTRAARSPPVSRPATPPEPHLQRLHQEGEGHLLHREPKSEEDVLWEQVLADLQLCTTRVSFDHWLRPTRLRALHRGVEHALLVVEVDTPEAAEWLENRQKPVIQRAVEGRLRQSAEIRFQARETVGL
jgi:hypothetical protein